MKHTTFIFILYTRNLRHREVTFPRFTVKWQSRNSNSSRWLQSPCSWIFINSKMYIQYLCVAKTPQFLWDYTEKHTSGYFYSLLKHYQFSRLCSVQLPFIELLPYAKHLTHICFNHPNTTSLTYSWEVTSFAVGHLAGERWSQDLKVISYQNSEYQSIT